MKETSGDSYKPINEQLYEHGSWLYREEGRKWSLGMFFDPDTEEFKEFPGVYKMLVLKELFQSGITPAMLEASCKAYCKETHPDKPYQDYGLLLLELIKEIIVWDLRDIDNNAPMNWYRTVKSDPPEITEHEVVLRMLESSSSDLSARLKSGKSLGTRKRIILLEHSLLHPEFKVVGNGNPLLDQEDYNLLDALVGQANV